MAYSWGSTLDARLAVEFEQDLEASLDSCLGSCHAMNVPLVAPDLRDLARKMRSFEE